MASLLGNPSSRFGDNLVGHVLPRIATGRSDAGVETRVRRDAPIVAPLAPRSVGDERQAASAATGALLLLTRPTPQMSTTNRPAATAPLGKTKVTGKRKLSNYYNTPVRRQQCRANQARYRDRQRTAQLQLEKDVEHLQHEVATLKRIYRDLSSRERSSQSPWSIVAEVSRLLENSFRSPWRMSSDQDMKGHAETKQILAVLEQAFAHDIAMGDLVGVEALMEQLRCYSQYFGEPHLKLQQIESAAPDVMVAKACLSVTVTELTMKNIFPYVENQRDESGSNESLYDRLLGRRLQLCCSMRFLFDQESCRVVRLETQIDMMKALHRSLGSLEAVSDVLEHARITSEGIIST